MKINALETIRLDEFPNLLWTRIFTDQGCAGIGETFYGAQAVEAHIHETLAPRLLGADPLRIEYLNASMTALPVAQASTGVEYRAASALDIALWDLFGKYCGQPVYQLLGGRCFDRLRVYNTCAGYRYVRSRRFPGAGELDAKPRWGRSRISTALPTAPTRLPRVCSRAASRR